MTKARQNKVNTASKRIERERRVRYARRRVAILMDAKMSNSCGVFSILDIEIAKFDDDQMMRLVAILDENTP